MKREIKILSSFLFMVILFFAMIGISDADFEGTIGTRFTITNSGFGTKKPQVYIGYEKKPGVVKKVYAKVEGWSDTSITGLWTGALPPGTYNLFVKPNIKGAVPVYEGTFSIMNPVIDEVTPGTLTPGATITINGQFFTSRKPVVYLKDLISQKKKVCRVLNATMNPDTGASSLSFVTPKWGSGSYEVNLQNSVGRTSFVLVSISGKVTDASAENGVPGVTVNLDGTGSNSVVTDNNGAYSFTNIQNGSYTITPTKSGYTFSPHSITVTVNNFAVIGQDFVGTPAGPPLSSEKAITAFSFSSPPATASIDTGAKTISLTVPYGTNVSALVADFTTTGKIVMVNGTIQVSGKTPNDFSAPVSYSVEAADGSVATYTVYVTVAPFIIPVPTGVSIASGDGYALLKWNNIPGLTDKSAGIAIARKTGASGSYSIVGSVPIEQTTYIDTGLSPNTVYYYKLYTYLSYEATDISEYTPALSITTTSSNRIPTAPTGLTATIIDGWTVDLSWSDTSNNEDGFTIERSTDNNTFTELKQTYANVTSFRDNFLLENKTYYYRVKAFDAFGTSAYSPLAIITTPNITPTFLGGSVAQNVTLTLAHSPYLVTSFYTLAPGYTLTIEPGVHIRFAPSIVMEVRGHLEAVGTLAKPIIFTAADPTTNVQASWNGIHVASNLGGSAIIRYANISHADIGVTVDRDEGIGPVDIYDSVFDTNSEGVGYYSRFKVMIYRSLFVNNLIAVGDADKIIAYSKFQNNSYGVGNYSYYPSEYGADRTSVYYSIFEGNMVALKAANESELRYSVVQYNNKATEQQAFHNMDLLYNTIANNNNGIEASAKYNSGTSTIKYNNIFGNTNYDFRNTDSSAWDASNNWWGTTSSSAIDSKIWDFFDDASLGIASYLPILAAPIDSIP